MSILSICQDVAKSIPIEAPSILVGSSEETSILLLQCCSTAGRSIMKAHNWTSLITEYAFSTVASQEDYSLPSDFDRLENQTLWDRDNYEAIRGPLTPAEWQEYKSSVLSNSATIWKRYRIRNVSGSTVFSIFPTPTAVESLVFEYLSKNWVESSGGTGQSSIADDTDVPVVDDWLLELGTKWRLLKRMGMDYMDEKVEYDNELRMAIARDGGAKVLNLAGRRKYNLIGPQNVPDSGYGS